MADTVLTPGQRVAKLYVRVVETAGLGTEKHAEPVDAGQPEPGRPFALEHRNLVAKRNEFELQRGPVSKAWEDGGKQQSEKWAQPMAFSAEALNR